MAYPSYTFTTLGNVFARSMCIWTIIIIVVIVLLIVLLAWFIGNRKKTKIHYHHQQPDQSLIYTSARYCLCNDQFFSIDSQQCPYYGLRF